MAQVAVLVRITLEDPEKVDDLIARIKAEFKPVDIGTEDIGFGIKAVRALFYTEEEEGSSALEKSLGMVENVSNVDILSVDRLG